MKVIKCIIILLITVIVLTSCSFDSIRRLDRIGRSDLDIADSTFSKVVATINSRDGNGLKSLFCVRVQENTNNFENDVSLILDFIEGDIVAFSAASESGVSSSKNKDRGKYVYTIQSAFSIQTETKKYYVGMEECVLNDLNEAEVGITRISIIDSEDWNMDYVYRGNYEDSGIIIDCGGNDS